MNTEEIKKYINAYWGIKDAKRIKKYEGFDSSGNAATFREFTSKSNSNIVIIHIFDEKGSWDIKKLTPVDLTIKWPDIMTFNSECPQDWIDTMCNATTPGYQSPEEEDEEPLDFENWDIKSVNGNEVVIYHGGDWQEPDDPVTYRYFDDGNLYFKK